MDSINFCSGMGAGMEQCGAVGTVVDNSEFLPQLTRFSVWPPPPFIPFVVSLVRCVPASCYTG